MYTFEEMYRPKNIEDNLLGGQRRKRGVATLPAAPPLPSTIQPALQAAMAQAAEVAAPPPGLPPARTLADIMKSNAPGMGTITPAGPPPGVDDNTVPPAGVPSPRIGTETPAHLSPLGRKLAEYQTMRGADVSSKVVQQPWGYEEQPPKRPSRLREAIGGALQGAALASQGPTEGAAWRALGGAATGAAVGGVSPRTMQAFTRHQELGRLAGDIGQDQQIALGQARIEETEAQAGQRRAEPFLRAAELDRKAAEDREQREDREARRRSEDERVKISRERAEESARRNKVVEGKPTGTNERVVQNQIFRKDKDEVWRVAPGSPPPTPSAVEERRAVRGEEKTAKAKQAASLYTKGADYWDQAQSKRREAEALPRNTPNRDERVKQLLREATGLESKTREVQLKGDTLAAESESADTVSDTEQRLRDAATKAGLDPDEAVRRARAKGRLN